MKTRLALYILFSVSLVFFTSETFAQNWQPVIGADTISANGAQSICVNPRNKNTIWFGGYSNIIRVSDDGGQSISRTVVAPRTYVTTLLIHPTDTSLIFFGSYQGCFKSTNGGLTWQQALPDTNVAFNGESITVEPNHPDTLYAGLTQNKQNSSQIFFRSFDRGQSWISLPIPGKGFCTITATGNGVLLAGSLTGIIYRSSNYGNAWDTTYAAPESLDGNGALIKYEVPKISFRASNPNIVWAALWNLTTPQAKGPGRLVKSGDNGLTWTEITNLGIVNPWAVEVDEFNRVFVGMFGGQNPRGAFISTDAGASWTVNASGFSENIDGTVWMIKSNGDSLGVFLVDGQLGAYKLANPTLSVVASSLKTSVNEYLLDQNYPNPFNPTTTITYQLPTTVAVSLKVYDLLGREVATLINERKASGRYTVPFDASKFSSGTYFYRLAASSGSGSFTSTKKMILLK